MTTTVLRPDGTAADEAVWVRTGGVTKHGVLADDSDATYITWAASNTDIATITFDLGSYTLPAGAVTKSATLRARARLAVAGSERPTGALTTGGITVVPANVWVVNTTGFVTYSSGAVAVSLSQSQIAALRFDLRARDGVPPVLSDINVAELYVDLVTAEIPVANITYPTGTPAITTTNRPTYTWTHTAGSDGGPQTFYEIKVYTAAQYGAGGFSPDTSTPFWTTGVVVGSTTSQLSGALTNSTTYRVYVRTAQTINGAAQWSAWDFEGFSISVTTSDVSAIATTADNTNGRILIAVDRSGSAWDFIEVQRSLDSGTTWEYIRGGQYVPPATTTPFSTGDANNFDIYDYELANTTTAIYRARATRIVSGLPITGAWVQSTPAISWTSTAALLKAPNDPTLNLTVRLSTVPELGFDTPQGVFPVLGRPNPVVVSDVMSGVVGSTLTIQTVDATEMADLLTLLRTTRLLFQPPSAWNLDARYIAVGKVTQRPVDPRLAINTFRRFDVSYNEIDAPADPLAGSP